MDLDNDRVFHEHGSLGMKWSDPRFAVIGILDGRALDSGTMTFEITHPEKGHIRRIRQAVRKWSYVRDGLVDTTEISRSWVVVSIPNDHPGHTLDEAFKLSQELFGAIHTRVYGDILWADARRFQTHPTKAG